MKKGSKPWQPFLNISYSIWVKSMSSVKEMQKVKLNLGKLELKFSTKLVYPILPNIKKFGNEKPLWNALNIWKEKGVIHLCDWSKRRNHIGRRWSSLSSSPSSWSSPIPLYDRDPEDVLDRHTKSQPSCWEKSECL